MALYKWVLHLLFFASVVGSGLGFSFYCQTHYATQSERVSDADSGNKSDISLTRVEAKDRATAPIHRDLDGDLLVVVLATRLLDETDGELETQVRSFLSLTSRRLLGGKIRVVGRTSSETWPTSDGRGKLWSVVEGFKRDEADHAFAALFAEMEALRARAIEPGFHTIVLWKCDLNPDSVAESAESPEPPAGARMSLFWLSDPEYPRSMIPARFRRWFGKSITSLGTEVQGLSHSLLKVASKYPAR
jgi:hypothetical protein